MTRARTLLLTGLLACLAFCGCSTSQAEQPLTTVADVDLERYAGRWYEIARLPNRFQKKCDGNVEVQYGLREDGRVDVLNSCRKIGGGEMSAKGVARRAAKNGPASRLEVRFAPAFLSFLPAVWGDYQVIDLAPDYSWAVVGEPARRYLWVLARETRMDDAELDRMIERAAKQGYDVAPLIRTRHSN